MVSNALLRVRSALISIPLIVLGTVAAALAVLTLAAIAPHRRGPGSWRDSCKRAWARYLLAVSFVRASMDGAGNLNPSRAYVFCANHLSYLDPPLLAALLPMPVRFIAKKSLFSIPLFGWAMRATGEVDVSRESARSAAHSIARGAELVRRGFSLVVFPEGGRSFDGALQPFFTGAFRLAIQARAPIVPVAILGTRDALRPGSLFIRGGAVRVVFGEPIPTEGLSARERKALAARVEAAIRQMLG